MRTIVYAIWHAVGRDRSRSLHQEARPTFPWAHSKEKRNENRDQMNADAFDHIRFSSFLTLECKPKGKRERTDQQFFLFLF